MLGGMKPTSRLAISFKDTMRHGMNEVLRHEAGPHVTPNQEQTLVAEEVLSHCVDFRHVALPPVVE